MAVYSERYNYLFFANPQTASTAITETMLQQLDGEELHFKMSADERANSKKLQHMNAYDVLETGLVTQETFDRAFKVTGVRNPFDMLVSRYLKRSSVDLEKQKSKLIARPGKKKFVRSVTAAAGQTFPEWIKSVMREGRTAKSQKRFIELVDFVIRFEHLQDDFLEFQRRAGIDSPVRVMKFNISQQRLANEAQKKPYTDFYDDESRQIVGRVYEEIIEQFGYRFGDA